MDDHITSIYIPWQELSSFYCNVILRFLNSVTLY